MSETIINNLHDLETFAYSFANDIKAGQTICLTGDLGAGKTTFVRYIAQCFKTNEPVQSPTFNILLKYKNNDGLVINHFDLYRLDSEEDLENIGFFEEVESNAINFIEWAEKFKDCIPQNAIWLKITKTGETSRKISY